MEDIEKRLRESTDVCIKSFENWTKQAKSLEARETLMEAMHEVRKVISRVEIEIAISERDRLGSRPIPIPPHRSSNKRGQGEDGGEGDDEGFDEGQNFGGGDNNQQSRRPQHGGGRGGQRRPMNRNNNDRDRGNNNGNNGNSNNSDNQPQ